MKIEIRFTADQDDDAKLFPGMDGKTITMRQATRMELSCSNDIVPDGTGGRAVGDTGGLDLQAHGQRAVWSEDEPAQQEAAPRQWGPEDVRPSDAGTGWDLSDEAAAEIARLSFGDDA